MEERWGEGGERERERKDKNQWTDKMNARMNG
jgi:hypothetical protein